MVVDLSNVTYDLKSFVFALIKHVSIGRGNASRKMAINERQLQIPADTIRLVLYLHFISSNYYCIVFSY